MSISLGDGGKCLGWWLNSRFWAFVVSFVMSYLHLHSKHILLSFVRASNKQQADIFVAKCVKVSNIINVVKCVIVISTRIVTVIGTKVPIIVITRAGIISCLLSCIDQLRRAAPRGEEEEQNKRELYAMPLCGEGRGVACPVVVE
jgi:hypothetical protein